MSASNSSLFSTHTATLIIVVLTSLVVGFKLGSISTTNHEPEEVDKENHAEALQEVQDADLAAIDAKPWEPCKLVLVVRTDLRMSPGDISAQCSDATLACYKALMHKNPWLVQHWEATGQAKIALKCASNERLLELETIARTLNLCARVVHNEELTRANQGTQTVLAIGPAPVNLINQVTGSLRLL